MSHIKLTHPTRPDLVFRQAQQDEDSRESVTNVAPVVGTDEPPFVHVTTRNRERSLQGRVSAPRRARNDSNTDEWEQSLANYVDRLEAHLDEFQGEGYTLDDDLTGASVSAIYTDLEWSIQGGSPYIVEFDVGVTVGRGIFESESIGRRNPSVDTAMSVAARVGGEDLPGLRELRVSRAIDVDVAPIYNVGNAEDNVVAATSGQQQTVTFRGTLTGDRSTRRTKDQALAALEGTRATFETRFPGYDLDGTVVGYTSTFNSSFGTQKHDYQLDFIESQQL